MYYHLVGALKRRLISELRDSFSRHPIYSKLTPFIQNKYAFDERPQFGIVVKGASANKVVLSADNFIGTIESHVMLMNVGEPVHPIEWVREDLGRIRDNGDTFPLLPGIYYIEILQAPDNPKDPGKYVVDPLLTISDEALLQFQSGIEREAQLQNLPAPGTVRLWLGKNTLLKEGKDYTLDYKTGAVTLLVRAPPSSVLTADYRYAAPSMGPFDYYWNQADHESLPGVIMAFGKRGKVGDKVAVVVYQDRVNTAKAYGGRFDVNFDLDVISQDPNQMEEISDLLVMYLWGVKRDELASEGITLMDISMGGESEESYDETSDTYYYNASISVQIQSDWEIHYPIPLVLSRINQTATTTSHGLEALASGMYYQLNPIIPHRNQDFERIL